MNRNYNKCFRRGFTLTELVVYIMLSTLVIGISLATFFFFKKVYWNTSSSFSIQQDAQKAIRWLKKDLTTTSLASITVYPSENTPDALPGVSFISAVNTGDTSGNGQSSFELTEYGSPKWSKYVCYTLVPSEAKPSDDTAPRMGNLVRWEYKDAGSCSKPIPISLLPSSIADGATVHTIVNNVLLPKSPPIAGIDSLKNDNVDCGGFKVAFLRKQKQDNGAEQLFTSSINPSQVSDDTGSDTAGEMATSTTTELVRVEMIFIQNSKTTGKTSAYQINFDIHPRN